MTAKVKFWFYHQRSVMTATHNVLVESPRKLSEHIDRVSGQYYTCREIGGSWVVDGRWTGIPPRVLEINGQPCT